MKRYLLLAVITLLPLALAYWALTLTGGHTL